MKLHVLQHVAFEGPGCIETWALGKGHALSFTRLYENAALPALERFDWLVVMGGPMNVYELNEYPWLCAEKKFIAAAIAEGKTVLGICLGAQLIADVLGAPVTRNARREIGWLPVEWSEEARRSPLFDFLPRQSTVFHWHGDTFALPKGATLLASSVACRHQAFQINKRVIGLQFHLEVTRKNIETLIANCGNELVQARHIQDSNEILSAATDTRMGEINAMMHGLLDRLEQ